jgi:hypothetical protein
MKYACFLFLLTLVFGLTVEARAQGAPYSDPQGNVGSWSWDKPQPKNSEESDESEEGDERKLGETSWERMQAEQTPTEREPPRQEVLKSLSPASWWRWWRGEQQIDTADSAADEPTSDSAEEETLDDSQEPTTEGE